MAHRSWLSLAIWSFCFLLVLAIQSHRVNCSSRGGPIDLTRRLSAIPPVGICESIVIPHGYKCQEFQVKTEDGYILSMQRIPKGRFGSGDGKNKQPVLLQHGILVDGASWFLNAPDQSLGFILADSGYDVWIANTRGTRFSHQHATLDPAEPAYWHWSWDELVAYDLPATFDLVYRQTGQKLHYVGHSLGTLVALASFSEGKMVDKVRSAALLCPIAYLSHMTTTLGVVAAKALAKTYVGEIAGLFGIAEFNLNEKPVADFLEFLCSIPGVDCYNIVDAITGKNCCLNASTFDAYSKNVPQSTSIQNLVHLSQTIRDGIVAKYDYGNAILNMENYEQRRPPIYNLSNIPHNLPIFISHGGRDALANPQDVGTLLDSLKFHDEDKLTIRFIKDYAHIDFVMGVSAKGIVYDAMIAFFRQQ